MKKLLLILALTLVSTFAFATPPNPIQPNATAKATAGGYDGGDYKAAASAAGTASSDTTAPCRYLDQWAASVVVISGSSTKMLRDLVCTLEKPLNKEQKLALCIESGDYRELRYYISTLPPENNKPQEGACPVGGSSKVMGIK